MGEVPARPRLVEPPDDEHIVLPQGLAVAEPRPGVPDAGHEVVVERLFGVSKARAATLMQTFGAELTGNQRTLTRTKLLQQLRNTAAGPRSASRRNVGSAWSASSGRRG